ncbi:MAG: 3-oxoacyl-ACP reductase FabG [Limnochordales bacterium]|nr:3-oxoacyl-ACP reductase family protein [Limnochordales bacterium]
MLRGGQLTGQVAIVTGAARGIGRAIALALAQEGAAVVVNYRVHAEAAEQVVQAIRAMGSDAVAVQADVTCPHAARSLVQAALDRWGRVDILVNNAGVALYRLLLDTSVDEWDAIMAVHLRGAFNCSQAVLPHMLRAGRGRIINISSVWGQVGAANEVAYSTAKAGLIGFTRALAKEVGRAGITVNAVAPGAIETDMLNGLSEAERAELAADIPLSRLGQPADAAAAVVFLASPAASYVTGQVISPNGGMAM